MEKRSEAMLKQLWDQHLLETLVTQASEIVRETVETAGDQFLRDYIRTEATTNELLRRFGARQN